MTASAIPCDARQASIGGVWRSAANGDALALENPFDGTPLACIAAVVPAFFGTRVVALNPVAGETPLLKAFMGEDTPDRCAKFVAPILIGCFSTPEDLANAACFLCRDAASMTTGAAMEVGGGRCV